MENPLLSPVHQIVRSIQQGLSLLLAGTSQDDLSVAREVPDFDRRVENSDIWGLPPLGQQDLEGSLRVAYLTRLEMAVRSVFNHLLVPLIIPAARQDALEQCEPGLIFWLIEELLDSQTIDGCKTVFDYLESRRERITAKHFRQKNLVILRSCNELLRRLSRAENAVFCGRVFIFLFQSFPLGDKSSVNLRGEYHTENRTRFEKLPPKVLPPPQEMDVDMDGEEQGGMASKPIKSPKLEDEGGANEGASAAVETTATAAVQDTFTTAPEQAAAAPSDIAVTAGPEQAATAAEKVVAGGPEGADIAAPETAVTIDREKEATAASEVAVTADPESAAAAPSEIAAMASPEQVATAAEKAVAEGSEKAVTAALETAVAAGLEKAAIKPPENAVVAAPETAVAAGSEPAATKPAEKAAVAPPDKAAEEASSKLNKRQEASVPKAALDYDTLYPIFWSLQELFSNPTSLFELAVLEQFKHGLAATLLKFQEVQKEADARGALKLSEDGKRGTKRRRGDSSEDLASNYNPKYLTSRDLFELEMTDLAFRRHISVQALIVVDFLLSLTARAKAKLADLKTPNKSAAWATEAKAEIGTYLQHGLEGKFYYRMVDTVLCRDKNWVRWKAESCPPIEVPPVSPQVWLDSMDGADKACEEMQLREHPLGSLELDFLEWGHNLPVNWKRLEDPRLVALPEIESFQSRIEEQNVRIAAAEGDEVALEKQIDKKTSMMWRALRVAVKDRLVHFDKLENYVQDIRPVYRPEYLGLEDGEELADTGEGDEGDGERDGVEGGEGDGEGGEGNGERGEGDGERGEGDGERYEGEGMVEGEGDGLKYEGDGGAEGEGHGVEEGEGEGGEGGEGGEVNEAEAEGMAENVGDVAPEEVLEQKNGVMALVAE
ncbi:MAG: hypothetical protein M1826_006113 [Phylliscum demangeonii]|nr:MAG: hypothetical protein M1826_006113 [Phylliscum demangeonii]